MAANPTPRQVVKNLVQGIAPERPLFLPIVFSLGSRVENVSLRTFLGNPTKISNSLRQIHGYLRADGLTCYFDSSLEAEALGGTLEWKNEDQPPDVSWPARVEIERFGEDLRSPEDVVLAGRIPVACEVIRRLRALLREDSLLMAGVTGPFTLASGLLGMKRQEVRLRPELPGPAVEYAAALTSQISAKFVEAGADLVFIVEEILPALSRESCEAWASLLAPTFNLIRFYEAMPVLLLTDSSSVAANRDVLFDRRWQCVLCPAITRPMLDSTARILESSVNGLGIALPTELFQSQESTGGNDLESILGLVRELRPVLLTTAGDVPNTADMKHVSKILGGLHRLL